MNITDVKEGADVEWSAPLLDTHTRQPVPLAALLTITLIALYNADVCDDAGNTIKGQENTPIFVASDLPPMKAVYGARYVIDATDPDDPTVLKLFLTFPARLMPIADRTSLNELHVMLLQVVHTGGSFPVEHGFRVENLRRFEAPA